MLCCWGLCFYGFELEKPCQKCVECTVLLITRIKKGFVTWRPIQHPFNLFPFATSCTVNTHWASRCWAYSASSQQVLFLERCSLKPLISQCIQTCSEIVGRENSVQLCCRRCSSQLGSTRYRSYCTFTNTITPSVTELHVRQQKWSYVKINHMTYPYSLKPFEEIHNIYNLQRALFCAVDLIIILNIFSTLLFLYLLLRRFASLLYRLCCRKHRIFNAVLYSINILILWIYCILLDGTFLLRLTLTLLK